ncbi:hypothetical protein [Burkholderia ubonensis]|uniref:hypothetical protein n=1 Tax=Burkholderia ubonensis TaxID=101571 RepID=UPI0012F978F8|nr:hypothetical protein [Burkholderia ubonensis]
MTYASDMTSPLLTGEWVVLGLSSDVQGKHGCSRVTGSREPVFDTATTVDEHAPAINSAPLPRDEHRATGNGMNRIADRAVLLICGVVFAGIAWATFRYAGEWVMPVVTAVTLAALGSEVRRLRRLLEAHGIDWRPRGRSFRK